MKKGKFCLLLFCLSGLVSFGQTNTSSTVKDIEGNVYKTVIIGKQEWMVENLRVTKYNDGTSIPLVTDNTVWKANYDNNTEQPMMCYYDNLSSLTNEYGGLYNWYVVNTKKLCPIGWHVPSDEEWSILTNYIDENAATKLKSKTGSWRDNVNGIDIKGDDIYGFSALSGGFRSNSGKFYLFGSDGCWWSSTSNDVSGAWGRNLSYYTITNMYRTDYYKVSGFSVRCLRD